MRQREERVGGGQALDLDDVNVDAARPPALVAFAAEFAFDAAGLGEELVGGRDGGTYDDGVPVDLVGTIIDRISSQVNAARDAGVAPDKIVVDPGLGFSLTNDQCWQILEELPRLTSCGYPVLIGASRKRFVKALGGDVDTDSAAIAAYAVRAGAWAVRVHDVAATAAAIARKENDGE